MGLSLLGMAISAYLTYTHVRGEEPFCGPARGCATVQGSPYASLWGVPVALWGFLLYVALAALPLAERGVPSTRRVGPTLSMVLALAGLGYAAYLTWLELFVIGAICWWCVASALVLACLAGLTTWRAWQVAA